MNENLVMEMRLDGLSCLVFQTLRWNSKTDETVCCEVAIQHGAKMNIEFEVISCTRIVSIWYRMLMPKTSAMYNRLEIKETVLKEFTIPKSDVFTPHPTTK